MKASGRPHKKFSSFTASTDNADDDDAHALPEKRARTKTDDNTGDIDSVNLPQRQTHATGGAGEGAGAHKLKTNPPVTQSGVQHDTERETFVDPVVTSTPIQGDYVPAFDSCLTST